MSDGRSTRVRSKKKKKMKSKFLLTSKKCWLIEKKLLPLYQHLVDGYSIQLREEWTVKVEEMDVEVVQQVKEEPLDDYMVDSQQLQLSSRMNELEVNISFCECDSFTLFNIAHSWISFIRGGSKRLALHGLMLRGWGVNQWSLRNPFCLAIIN